MIRRQISALVSATAAVTVLGALIAASGVVQAQPYGGDPDPYGMPQDYNQVTGYEGQGQDQAAPAEDYAPDGAPADRGYVQDAPYADDGYVTPGDPGRGYYNSGATAREQSSYSRQGYVRSGESYSSRETATSQEAYVGGEVRERGRSADSDYPYADDPPRASVGAPVYVDENGVSREGEASRYGERSGQRSGYASASSSASSSSSSSSYVAASSARFGYQRRFYAFEAATEQSETSSVVRREDFGYVRRESAYPYRNDDLHLDGSSQLALTGGVEGSAYVASSSSGGGYASASASASAFAGARAFAGVRGGRGHPGGHGGCGCGHGRH